MSARYLSLFILFGLMLAPGVPVCAAQQADSESETVAKPMSEREQRRRERALRQELERPFRRWLDEDVGYIITAEERQTFGRLQTAEEIESFIEQFWLRRDPTPDSFENEYKEEHYRRIAYANERFASGIQGWRSDRGRIYIAFGPPDERTQHAGGSYRRPRAEGGGQTQAYPFEIWRYRWLEGIGDDVNIEFVDPTMTGEFRLTMDPTEKDALMYVPGAGLTDFEASGLAERSDRFSRTDGTHLGTGDVPLPSRMNQFERLRQFSLVFTPPPVKFTDLETAMVDSTIRYNLLPMETRVDFMRMTNSTIMTNVTLQFDRKDLQFEDIDGVSRAVVNIFARITTMTRRNVNTFEDVVSVEVPTQLLAQASRGVSVYQQTVPLAPGNYRLNIVAKDIVSENMSVYELALRVPYFDDDTLGVSSLVLADVMEKVPTRSIGAGQFVIGTSKVRPRLGETFRRDEKMGIYLQVYNFGLDAETGKPAGSIEYEVVNNVDNQQVLSFTEDITGIEGASASQTVVEKLLPLQSLEPGDYTLRMKVTDKVRGETLIPEAVFKVT